MIDKMLKVFCADQIKILLERMDSHPEEFDNYEVEYGKFKKWKTFMPGGSAYEYFNRFEKRLIENKFRKINYKNRKQAAYNGILERLVQSPESESILGDTYAAAIGQSIRAAKEQVAESILTAYNTTVTAKIDPRVIEGWEERKQLEELKKRAQEIK